MNESPDKLKIKGGNVVYGDAELSGDSVNSMALMVSALMSGNDFEISNVPRSPIVLKFIKTLETFGVVIQWISVDTVKISFNKSMPSDITYLSEKEDIEFVKLLVPLILKKRGECRVSNSMKSDLSFYKERGFEVKTNRSYSTIIYTKDLINLSSPIDFKNLTSSFDISSRFLILNLIGFNEDELKYVVNTKNVLDSWYSNLLFGNVLDSNVLRARSSRSGFTLLSSIAVLTQGEISISNFDLSEMLSYLLLLEKFGGRYIVSDHKIKIWNEKIELEPYYDFTYLDNDYVGFSIISTVVLSRKSDFVIQLKVRKIEAISFLLRTLNIIGFDLRSKEIGEDILIIIRPVRLPVKIKLSFSEPYYLSQLLALSVAVDGVHTLNGTSDLLFVMPNTLDVLKELGVDIST